MLTLLTVILTVLAFKAEAACPNKFGKNVVKNSGFEARSLAPWKVEGRGDLNAGVRHPGYRSSSAFGTGPPRTTSQRFLKLSQSFKSCPGQSYILSYRYKFIDSEYPNNAIIYSPMGDLFQGIRDFPQKINNTWIQNQQYFTGGDEVSIFADLSSTKQGRIFLDEVKIFPQPPLRVKRGAKNLVKNGGFNSGKLGPWSGKATQYCAVSRRGFQSKFAFNCKFPEQDVSFPVASLEQTLPTVKNERYILEFDYKFAIAETRTQCSIDVGVNKLSRFNNIQTTMKGDGPWYHYKHGIVAPSSHTNLLIQLSSNSPSGPCNASVDNVFFRLARG